MNNEKILNNKDLDVLESIILKCSSKESKRSYGKNSTYADCLRVY
jgi:hypothetical protein